jgi:hypothetical protein
MFTVAETDAFRFPFHAVILSGVTSEAPLVEAALRAKRTCARCPLTTLTSSSGSVANDRILLVSSRACWRVIMRAFPY